MVSSVRIIRFSKSPHTTLLVTDAPAALSLYERSYLKALEQKKKFILDVKCLKTS